MSPAGNVNDPQLAQSGYARAWVQTALANPGVKYGYYGCLEITKPSQDLGAAEPVYCPSSAVRNQWDIVDTIIRTPALPKTDILQHASRFLTDVWIGIRNRGCNVNLQAIFSKCSNPSDFTQWESKMLLSGARLTKIDFGNLNALDGSKNAIVDITGSLEAQQMVFIYPLTFGEVASVTVVAEVVDCFYNDVITCGDCGVPSDGCQKAYALQVANAGSPGLSSQLLYSLDGAATWAGLDIPTLGGVSARRFAAVGLYCVVVGPNSGAYHYALFSDINAGIVNWNSQSSGFVAGKSPMCIWAVNPAKVFIGAQGGYIYLLSNVGSAVSVVTDGSLVAQDINDIHGYGQTVVAVGNNNAVLYSLNQGASWGTITGPLVGQNLSAVWCLSGTTWFVGTGNGKLYYTLNGGTTWTQLLFDAGNFTSINDIQFTDQNVGYMAVEIGGAGRVYRTTDGGATWRYTASDIQGLPTNQRINVVGPCGANNVLAAGRKTIGGDGILAVAKGPALI